MKVNEPRPKKITLQCEICSCLPCITVKNDDSAFDHYLLQWSTC